MKMPKYRITGLITMGLQAFGLVDLMLSFAFSKKQSQGMPATTVGDYAQYKHSVEAACRDMDSIYLCYS